MIIPSHIPNVPKWVYYSLGNIIAWLDSHTNSYRYHLDNKEANWISQKEITGHMAKSSEILPLTSLGYIIERIIAGYDVPAETIKLYVKDLLKEIHKEKQNG